MITAIFVFSGIVFGCAAGTLMPWADKLRQAPNDFGMYFRIFVSVGIVQVFLLGCLFFCVAYAAHAQQIVVSLFAGRAALFAFYLIELVVVITSNKLERTWASIADPMGLIMLQSLTRYWTVVERNSSHPALDRCVSLQPSLVDECRDYWR